MGLKGLLFLFRVITEIPLRIICNYLSIFMRVGSHRSCDIGLLKRIFMREAFALGDVSVCKEIINPVFNALNYCILGKTQSVRYHLTSVDCQFLQRKYPEWEKEGIRKNITARFWWFKRPKGFDPKIDQVLVVTHGGGYAIEFLPLNLIFLSRLSRAFPRMAIVIQRYTVTTTSRSKYMVGPPLQILETVALYETLYKDYNCRFIVALGDSAGANILLGSLQYLEITKRVVSPYKIVLISPWCNPTCFPRDEIARTVKFESLDCLSFEGLRKFSRLVKLGSPIQELDDDSLLNVERNFDVTVWARVLRKTRMMIWFGSEEILQDQIRSLVNKLVTGGTIAAAASVCNPSQNISENIVSSCGQNCGHIEPLLLFNPMKYSSWIQHSAIRPILEFLRG